ncbi:hypothetical protein K493DRAFT_336429 [Basidiobolus meristosporus CBS 931.73]|uniref:Uncharacterized protein n=1 Tax=Basidiobolus meristosporus CBS 931.73 TaxID=1314790 RepID=A0A1Y1YIE4_9FUNG|nr:hypothetical protein K493DRAFT_336429 [Basidiobolus meristosporus CBS 931.73]|eukprot:ORX97708.1 hypothetical protein K493DRAFT_336429 [Basidiobolus meristosporus CBS 931.73]
MNAFRQVLARRFTTSLPRLQEASSSFTERVATPPKIVVKKTGSFRGGFMGFLFGLTCAGGVGYYYLLEEYKSASDMLLQSVDELQASTNKVREYAQKIGAVEKELRSLKEVAATHEQLENTKADLRKLYSTIHSEHLSLKKNVSDIEHDVHALTNPNV